MPNDLRHKIFSGIIWKSVDKIGTYGISFVISILLSRILEPSEFGTIALAGILVTITNAFVDSGLGMALIQKKDADELDYNSVFYTNIVLSIIIFFVVCLCSPLLGTFYNRPELSKISRWLAVSLISGALGGVQRALLSRKMLFKLLCRITWGAQIPSGIIGVVMAFKGYGVWSLVAQQLIRGILQCFLLWFFVRWRPRMLFAAERLKYLFGFGWKMLCCGVIGSIFNNLNGLVIGKCYDVSAYAFYQKGEHLPNLGMTVVNDSLGGVLLPAFSSIQDDRDRMKRLFHQGIVNIMFFLCPALVLLAVLSQPIIYVLYTGKWASSIIFMQIFCFSNIFMPFHATNLQIVLATGHSDYYLFIEIAKKVLTIVVLCITVPMGVIAMAYGALVSSVFCVFINGFFAGKLINYSPWRQLIDGLPWLLISLFSGGIVWAVNMLITNNWLKLFCGSILFAGCYFVSCMQLRLIPEECSTIFKKYIRR